LTVYYAPLLRFTHPHLRHYTKKFSRIIPPEWVGGAVRFSAETRRVFKQEEFRMAAIEEKVKQIVSEQLSVDEGEVTPSASFVDDLGADSLDVVELVMAFEEAFDIEIPDEDAEKIKTVQDAIDYIDKKAKVRS